MIKRSKKIMQLKKTYLKRFLIGEVMPIWKKVEVVDTVPLGREKLTHVVMNTQ